MTYHLVTVAGTSGHALFNTLRAMHHEGDAWPDRLTVITTVNGRDAVWKHLREDNGLTDLCRSLGRPDLPFSQEDILVAETVDKTPLEDLRTRQDHEVMTDFIANRIQILSLNTNGEGRLHVTSGTDTLGISSSLGSIMSLFGRNDDRLTHVQAGDSDHADAGAVLLDVFFARQRKLLPAILQVEEVRPFTFRKLVNLMNLGDRPERVCVELHQPSKKMIVRDLRTDAAGQPLVEITFHFENTLAWAFYRTLAEATLDNESFLVRPHKGKAGALDAETGARALMLEMAELKGSANLVHPQMSSALMAQTLRDYETSSDEHIMNGSFEHYLRPFAETHKGLDRQTFDMCVNHVENTLAWRLPACLKELVMPKPCIRKGKIRREPCKGAGYGLLLPDPESQIWLYY